MEANGSCHSHVVLTIPSCQMMKSLKHVFYLLLTLSICIINSKSSYCVDRHPIILGFTCKDAYFFELWCHKNVTKNKTLVFCWKDVINLIHAKPPSANYFSEVWLSLYATSTSSSEVAIYSHKDMVAQLPWINIFFCNNFLASIISWCINRLMIV